MSVELGFVPVAYYAPRLEIAPAMPKNKDQLLTQPVEDLPILKEHFGDLRFNLAGMSAGLLQVFHPAIGAGVLEHSDFIRNPWGRIDRSLPQIGAMIYDRNREERAKEVRNKHRDIKGTDEKKRGYHAYDPETFSWAHDTFVWAAEKKMDVFDHRRVTPAHLEQLHQESKLWYSMYGLSQRPVPEDYASLQKKRNYIYDNVLEMTPVAQAVLTQLIDGTVERRPEISKVLWEMGLKIPGNELLRLLAIGGLPERVRERFNVPWSTFDAWKLKGIETTVRELLWPRETRMEWPANIRDPRYASWAQVQPWEREIRQHANVQQEGIIYAR